MTEIVDDLRAARALIDTEDKWAANGFERFAHKRTGGERLCAVDAVNHCEDPRRRREMWAALRKLIHEPVSAFNDTHSHADIMALFDRAIATALTKDTPQ